MGEVTICEGYGQFGGELPPPRLSEYQREQESYALQALQGQIQQARRSKGMGVYSALANASFPAWKPLIRKDETDPAVFDEWLSAPGNQTFEEWCGVSE